MILRDPARWAMRQDVVTAPTARLVNAALARHANVDACCRPSINALACATGLSRRTIQANIALLERAELVTVERGGGWVRRSIGRASTYVIAMPIRSLDGHLPCSPFLDWAWRAEVGSWVDRWIIVALGQFADAAGECEPGTAEIERATGLADRTIRMSLSRLEATGLISREKTAGRAALIKLRGDVLKAVDNSLGEASNPGTSCTVAAQTPASRAQNPGTCCTLTTLNNPYNADADASAAQRAARPQIHERIEATNSGHPEPEIISPPKSQRAGTHQQPAAGNRTRRMASNPRGGQSDLDLGDGWSLGGREAAAPFSAGKAIFDSGIRLLTSSGMREQQARRIIGRWRKSFPDIAILGALDSAARERPVDPVSWITATLRHRSDGANIINFDTKGSGHGQGQHHRDFADWQRNGPRDQRRRAYGPASQILAVSARLGYLD